MDTEDILPDEDGCEYWEANDLGFFSGYNSKKTHFFSISVRSEKLHPEAEKLNIDFHFKALLKDDGYKKVLTNQEYGKYLDDIEI